MTRRDFIKVCGVLGITLPFQSFTPLINKNNNNSGTVLIIGAGVAGMSAAYLLAQKGIEYKILEAAPTYGGRIRHNTSFSDFPIPLGAEWLHSDTSELSSIINDSSVDITTKTKAYQENDVVGYYDGDYITSTISEEFGTFEDKKFVRSSWLTFFENYIIPNIQSNFVFNTEVIAINYLNNKVIVNTNSNNSYQADKVIITVPLKVLQKNLIRFTPTLPKSKQRVIQKANIWGGIKVFIEFTEKFYPVFLTFPDSETKMGQRLYYDASYGQNSKRNILGLFAVGKQAEPYQKLSGTEQRDYILKELDTISDGLASEHYINHIVQDWDKEPFIQGAYLADSASSKISRVLSSTIDNKLYFSGEAYTRENDWGSVHNATRSAKYAVNEILNDTW